MGYAHIENLYKNQTILLFRRCWALEKVHGTSAHITYVDGRPLSFFSGGESHDRPRHRTTRSACRGNGRIQDGETRERRCLDCGGTGVAP